MADNIQQQAVKKLEEKLLKKLEGEASDNDSVICHSPKSIQDSAGCEVDELYYNFLSINKYYCVNSEYRIAKVCMESITNCSLKKQKVLSNITLTKE